MFTAICLILLALLIEASNQEPSIQLAEWAAVGIAVAGGIIGVIDIVERITKLIN